MSKPDIKLEVRPGGETVIRTGDALPAKHAKAIVLRGTLQAPANFYEGKKEALEVLECHLQIRNADGIIELHVWDTNPNTEHVITGKLDPDSVLAQFAINSDKRWGIQEFLKFVRTMKYYFLDQGQHKHLIESLQKWRVKVERVITEFNDQKGNSNFQLETKVQQSAEGPDGLLTSFDLNVPIFQGYPKARFKVEIGLDPRNTVVELFLISDELITLEIGSREILIANELAKFNDFHCAKVVIN